MTPTPCVVIEGDDRWPGRVLAWVHDDAGWHGVVRYTKAWPEGWPMAYEHAVPAGLLEAAGAWTAKPRRLGPRFG